MTKAVCGVIMLAAAVGCKGADKGSAPATATTASAAAVTVTQAVPAATATAAAAATERIVLKSEDLFAEYDANEVKADEKYKGKTLRVPGQIQSIDKDAFNNMVIKLKTANQFLGVHARMQDSQKAAVLELNKGQIVVVECIGGGMVMKSPILQDCTILKVGKVH